MAKKKPQRVNHIAIAIEDVKKEAQEVVNKYTKVELIDIKDIYDLITKENIILHNRISYNNSKFIELTNSIQQLAEENAGIMGTGLLNPIMVRKNNGKFERIHGENRIRAFMKIGLTQIPAIVVENVSDKLARFMRTSENINRDDLNAYDETLSILEYVQLACNFETLDMTKSFINKIKNQRSGKVKITEDEIKRYSEVADVFNKIGRFDIESFANRLVLLNVHPLIKQALQEEYLNYTQAVMINSKLKSETDIQKILALLKQKSMTKTELKEYITRFINESLDPELVKTNYLEKSKNASKVLTQTKYNKLNEEKKTFVDEKLVKIMELYQEIENKIA